MNTESRLFLKWFMILSGPAMLIVILIIIYCLITMDQKYHNGAWVIGDIEDKDTPHTHYFYSNCLVEALKAKIMDPKNVKLTFIPPKYNECPYCFHVLWSNGIADFDFGVNRKIRPWEIICFKGCIRMRTLGWNERYKKLRIAKYNKEHGGNHGY